MPKSSLRSYRLSYRYKYIFNPLHHCYFLQLLNARFSINDCVFILYSLLTDISPSILTTPRYSSFFLLQTILYYFISCSPIFKKINYLSSISISRRLLNLHSLHISPPATDSQIFSNILQADLFDRVLCFQVFSKSRRNQFSRYDTHQAKDSNDIFPLVESNSLVISPQNSKNINYNLAINSLKSSSLAQNPFFGYKPTSDITLCNFTYISNLLKLILLQNSFNPSDPLFLFKSIFIDSVSQLRPILYNTNSPNIDHSLFLSYIYQNYKNLQDNSLFLSYLYQNLISLELRSADIKLITSINQNQPFFNAFDFLIIRCNINNLSELQSDSIIKYETIGEVDPNFESISDPDFTSASESTSISNSNYESDVISQHSSSSELDYISESEYSSELDYFSESEDSSELDYISEPENSSESNLEISPHIQNQTDLSNLNTSNVPFIDENNTYLHTTKSYFGNTDRLFHTILRLKATFPSFQKNVVKNPKVASYFGFEIGLHCKSIATSTELIFGLTSIAKCLQLYLTSYTILDPLSSNAIFTSADIDEDIDKYTLLNGNRTRVVGTSGLLITCSSINQSFSHVEQLNLRNTFPLFYIQQKSNCKSVISFRVGANSLDYKTSSIIKWIYIEGNRKSVQEGMCTDFIIFSSTQERDYKEFYKYMDYTYEDYHKLKNQYKNNDPDLDLDQPIPIIYSSLSQKFRYRQAFKFKNGFISKFFYIVLLKVESSLNINRYSGNSSETNHLNSRAASTRLQPNILNNNIANTNFNRRVALGALADGRNSTDRISTYNNNMNSTNRISTYNNNMNSINRISTYNNNMNSTNRISTYNNRNVINNNYRDANSETQLGGAEFESSRVDIENNIHSNYRERNYANYAEGLRMNQQRENSSNMLIRLPLIYVGGHTNPVSFCEAEYQ
ncbi:hypothetical protein BB561_005899 [Smittium simulii]|uniref:Uncharacterized protein n=1 Tax=Smittium simulii TaxID=133385 RepID=A0A2T9Y7S6_9FUNG|nr:hypothetical protein BB561_005899 [Smittium simulii]